MYMNNFITNNCTYIVLIWQSRGIWVRNTHGRFVPPPRMLLSKLCLRKTYLFILLKATFYILLFAHLVMFLGKRPTWRTVLFYVFFQISTCFEQPRAHHNILHMSFCVGDRFVCRSERNFPTHTKRSPTQSDIYRILYWYNWFSWWWWARGCSKHVEN